MKALRWAQPKEREDCIFVRPMKDTSSFPGFMDAIALLYGILSHALSRTSSSVDLARLDILYQSIISLSTKTLYSASLWLFKLRSCVLQLSVDVEESSSPALGNTNTEGLSQIGIPLFYYSRPVTTSPKMSSLLSKSGAALL